VFERLREVAANTQPAVVAAIRQAGLEAVPFYIVNQILIEAPAGEAISPYQLFALAERGDVERLLSVERPPPSDALHSASRQAATAPGEAQQNIEQTGAAFLQ
jgi:hypothetical protein